MSCDEAVYLAFVLILFEIFHRFLNRQVADHQSNNSNFSIQAGYIFITFYLLSIISTIIYVSILHKKSFFSSYMVQEYMPFLYLFDSIGAVILGYSLYTSHLPLMIVSMVFLTNFLMIHILHRIFAGKKPEGMWEELVATTKAYIHHCSSFFFLDPELDREVIIITSCWRAISMSGHTVQSLHQTKFLSSASLYKFNWILSHTRNCIIVLIFYLCYQYPAVRTSFGHSAIGHIGYILVRSGPVFRLGSVYVGVKAKWQSFTDIQRILLLLKGYHPYLTIEVGSLLILGCLFLRYHLNI